MVKLHLVERKPVSPSTTQQPPTLGVIDAVSAGLDAVLRHPWLLLIPLALDLFLWVGPRVQAPALYRLFEPTLRQMLTEMPSTEGRLAVQELSKLLNAFFTQYNLFSWLSVGLVGVPVVNAGIDSTLKLVTGGLPMGVAGCRPGWLCAVDVCFHRNWLVDLGLVLGVVERLCARRPISGSAVVQRQSDGLETAGAVVLPHRGGCAVGYPPDVDADHDRGRI